MQLTQALPFVLVAGLVPLGATRPAANPSRVRADHNVANPGMDPVAASYGYAPAVTIQVKRAEPPVSAADAPRESDKATATTPCNDQAKATPAAAPKFVTVLVTEIIVVCPITEPVLSAGSTAVSLGVGLTLPGLSIQSAEAATPSASETDAFPVPALASPSSMVDLPPPSILSISTLDAFSAPSLPLVPPVPISSIFFSEPSGRESHRLSKTQPPDSTRSLLVSTSPAPSAPSATPTLAYPIPVPQQPSGFDFRSGVSYSPYDANSQCRSAAAVAMDITHLVTAGNFDLIRIYGTDCNQIANALAAIDQFPAVRLFVGIFDVDSAAAEAWSLVGQVAGRWNRIHTVNIGNEAVNQGRSSVGQVITAVGAVRGQLRGAGYSGPVVTVDTMNAMHDHPELCDVSDYCAFNCHAFFDPNTAADEAGPSVKWWIDQMAQVAGGKALVVTETGWPTAGDPNGKAVPSWDNHQVAMLSLKSTLTSNIILFSGYNNHWMADGRSTFGTEKFWGMYGDAPSAR